MRLNLKFNSKLKQLHARCIVIYILVITLIVFIGDDDTIGADEDAVEYYLQKDTIFNNELNIMSFKRDACRVDIVSDDDNERTKEVNDGLCGKSAPCCRGPRPRLSRTRHRLVIDWIQLLGGTGRYWIEMNRSRYILFGFLKICILSASRQRHCWLTWQMKRRRSCLWYKMRWP